MVVQIVSSATETFTHSKNQTCELYSTFPFEQLSLCQVVNMRAKEHLGTSPAPPNSPSTHARKKRQRKITSQESPQDHLALAHGFPPHSQADPTTSTPTPVFSFCRSPSGSFQQLSPSAAITHLPPSPKPHLSLLPHSSPSSTSPAGAQQPNWSLKGAAAPLLCPSVAKARFMLGQARCQHQKHHTPPAHSSEKVGMQQHYRASPHTNSIFFSCFSLALFATQRFSNPCAPWNVLLLLEVKVNFIFTSIIWLFSPRTLQLSPQVGHCVLPCSEPGLLIHLHRRLL